MARFVKNIDKEARLRRKAYLEERIRALTVFRDVQFIEGINPMNKNLLLGYMKFLAYTSLSLKTASNVKTSLKMFMAWNKEHNDDAYFKLITKKQAEKFFEWVKIQGYTETRANMIKTDLCDFADYLQYVIGREEYRHDGTANRWYKYNGQFWKHINVAVELDSSIIRQPNVYSFDREYLDNLHVYLKQKQDWMGVVILEYSYLGIDILKLNIDDEDFNRQPAFIESFFKWRTREQVPEDMKQVCVMRNNKTKEIMPMDVETLRGYAKMFSIFLGKEFIIC